MRYKNVIIVDVDSDSETWKQDSGAEYVPVYERIFDSVLPDNTCVHLTVIMFFFCSNNNFLQFIVHHGFKFDGMMTIVFGFQFGYDLKINVNSFVSTTYYSEPVCSVPDF